MKNAQVTQGAHELAPTTVQLDGITHRFGQVKALSELSFSVPTGQITVLLGPNGAGKTTAIRSITGALSPKLGDISVFGLDPRKDGDEIRPRCGVVSAKPALYDRLNGYDNLEYSARLYGVPVEEIPERISEAASRFEIRGALHQQVGGYSTGMKTRLALSRSVLHNPDLLLFDEPTSGLDPESSHAVLELIQSMRTENKTVVMCTHLLSEAEGLADHIVMMSEGSTICEGAPDALSKSLWPHPILILDAQDPGQLDRVANMVGVISYERTDKAHLELDGVGRVPQIVASLAADGVAITRVEPKVPTLEDLYFAVRGNSIDAPLNPILTKHSAKSSPQNRGTSSVDADLDSAGIG